MQIQITLGLASRLISEKAIDNEKDIINAISILKKQLPKIS